VVTRLELTLCTWNTCTLPFEPHSYVLLFLVCFSVRVATNFVWADLGPWSSYCSLLSSLGLHVCTTLLAPGPLLSFIVVLSRKKWIYTILHSYFLINKKWLVGSFLPILPRFCPIPHKYALKMTKICANYNSTSWRGWR
jgi:hypothetical protein